jgi:hypothetical protein
VKTAEVAIEHVLTGLLALAAFGLPLLSGLCLDGKFPQGEALVGVLGLAYLFGVVFDKLADTILSPLEQWLRLDQADKLLAADQPAYRGDPFPQDALEFSLRGEQDGRLEWMDSLRSRIRTSRGLAVLGLPAALGIAVFHHFTNDPAGAQAMWARWPSALVVASLLFLVGSVGIAKRFKGDRTDTLKKDAEDRKKQMRKATTTRRRATACCALLLIPAVTVSAAGAWHTADREALVIGACGAVATLLGLWSWRRITGTYLAFIARKLPQLIASERS